MFFTKANYIDPQKVRTNLKIPCAWVLNRSLFICAGGFDDNSPLDSVEKYDTQNNVWKTVAKMSCPRGGVGVAALGGRLYAVGGHDGTNYLNSVEAYDPMTDRYEFSSYAMKTEVILL